MKQDHEKEIQKDNWVRKMLWEEKVAEHNKSANEIRKDYEDLKEKVGNLLENKNDISPLDLNRIALLHLLLTGSQVALTPEILEQEVNKVKKSYEIIKDYVK